MSSEKNYDLKRKNFVHNTKFYFDFLTNEFDFDKPIYIFSKQLNGVVIADKFEFNNSIKSIKIIVTNSYHPVDYGFEIILSDLKSGTEEMIVSVLKENQDIEQSYLKNASEFLKNRYEQIVCRK